MEKPKIIIEGKLDMDKVAEFKSNLEEIISKFTVVTVDLAHCTYIDSKGLGILISSFNKLKQRGGRIEIVGANGKVKKIFELTKLDKLFKIN